MLRRNHSGSGQVIVRPERILIQPLFRRRPLAAPIATIVENEDGQSDPVEFAHILQPVDDISRVPMTPEHDRRRWVTLDVPAEQLRPVPRLKPDLFKRQAAAGLPILILPGIWVIDKELIKDTHRVLLRGTTI